MATDRSSSNRRIAHTRSRSDRCIRPRDRVVVPRDLRPIRHLRLVTSEEQPMSCQLHVGNLGRHTTADDLRVIFAMHGAVVDAEVITDQNSGRSRGFGFVAMASPQDAKAAIEAVNGHLVDGRGITVAVAIDRHR
jgi:hypothetical protein